MNVSVDGSPKGTKASLDQGFPAATDQSVVTLNATKSPETALVSIEIGVWPSIRRSPRFVEKLATCADAVEAMPAAASEVSTYFKRSLPFRGKNPSPPMK
jgi:hypothetical protein